MLFRLISQVLLLLSVLFSVVLFSILCIIFDFVVNLVSIKFVLRLRFESKQTLHYKQVKTLISVLY